MTLLLDIATPSLLLLALSFVPAMGLRHEAKVTREIREAQQAQAQQAQQARQARQARAEEDQRSATTQHVGLY